MIIDNSYYNIFFFLFFILWLCDLLFIPKNNLKSHPAYTQKINYKFVFLKIIIFTLACKSGFHLYNALNSKAHKVEVVPESIFANDIYLVLDVSKSMDAIDFKPNRYEVAKKRIREFVKMRTSDQVGLILFSEKIMTLVPLTFDKETLFKLLEKVKVGDLGQGTNMGDALALAIGKLKKSKARNKIIILMTDGVSQVDSITPLEAAGLAKESEIKIFSIGIGSNENALLPMYKIGKNWQYQKIPGGSIDFKVLKKISKMTNGSFFWAKDDKKLKEVFLTIQSLEKSLVKVNSNHIKKYHYYEDLLIGLLLFIFVEVMRRVFIRDSL